MRSAEESTQDATAAAARQAASESNGNGAVNGNAGPGAIRRRFVEAARRAEIIGLVNRATTEAELGIAFSEELCEVFDAEIAFITEEGATGSTSRAVAAVGIPAGSAASMLGRAECVAAISSGRATALHGDHLLGTGMRATIIAPFSAGDGRRGLVAVGRTYDQRFDEADRSLVEAVTLAVAQALDRIWLFEAHERGVVQQSAMVRAAKSMSRSLDISEVVQTLCEESRQALDCDSTGASLGDEIDGYVVVGSDGMPPEYTGFRRPPGQGLGGRAVQLGRVMITHTYQEEGFAPPEAPGLENVRSSVAVPLRWNGRIRGFISAGFHDERRITSSDVELIEGFAELAGLACANAERHQAVREAADLDELTGCLNRRALESRLREMLAADDGDSICLALLDLDDFKSINDVFGHLSGDTVLGKVGDAIRSSIRGGDIAGRYGGDEFALVLPDADERSAGPVLDRVRAAIASIDVPGGRITACLGVAERSADEPAASLIGRADEALRDAKVSPGPGLTRRASRRVTMASSEDAGVSRAGDPDRRQRWRAVAGDIGLAVTRQLEPISAGAIAAREIRDVLDLEFCSILRLVADGQLQVLASSGGSDEAWKEARTGSVGRALREKRSILDDKEASRRDADLRASELDPATAGCELAVPLIVGGRAWGVICCRAEGSRMDDIDAGLVSSVADHLASSIRAGDLYEQLTESMIGTAESLAAALEAKDSYTADHARSIAELAVEVGRELGLPESSIEDLRYAGIFHDVGKIAVPDALLNKPDSLTDAEFKVVMEHPVVGAEILAPVPFLYGVRTIVRHAHEHWDGSGYPDGLSGPQIPLGARIVLAVDAYHAMTSDRPYRARMSHDDACEELRTHSGSQFDPEVIDAFLAVLDRRAAAA